MRTLMPAALVLLGACATAAAPAPMAATAAASEPSTMALGQSDPTRPHCFLSPEGDQICPAMGAAIVYDEAGAAQMAARAPEGGEEMSVAEDVGAEPGAHAAPAAEEGR